MIDLLAEITMSIFSHPLLVISLHTRVRSGPEEKTWVIKL